MNFVIIIIINSNNIAVVECTVN